MLPNDVKQDMIKKEVMDAGLFGIYKDIFMPNIVAIQSRNIIDGRTMNNSNRVQMQTMQPMMNVVSSQNPVRIAGTSSEGYIVKNVMHNQMPTQNNQIQRMSLNATQVMNKVGANFQYQQNLGQSMQKTIPQGITQTMPQTMTQGLGQSMTQNIAQNIPQSMTQNISQNMTQNIPQNMTQSIPQNMNQNLHQNMAPNMHKNVRVFNNSPNKTSIQNMQINLYNGQNMSNPNYMNQSQQQTYMMNKAAMKGIDHGMNHHKNINYQHINSDANYSNVKPQRPSNGHTTDSSDEYFKQR